MTLALPRHGATTRHAASAYPFQAQPGLGGAGPVIGSNLYSGGSFAWDPWALYERGVLTNPNLLVVGQVGSRKSTLVKAMLWRQVGAHRDRWCAVVDPKGEYRALAEALGLAVIRLAPGGACRLNPLDAGPLGDEDPRALARRRAEMVAHLATVSLSRRITSEERAAIDAAAGGLGDRPELGHVVALLLEPTEAMATASHTTTEALKAAVRDVALELRRLLVGDLAGMFDGSTTVDVDWRHGHGLVLDLSAVFGTDALPLVMLCATTWLQSLLTIPGGPKRIVVLDEAWAVLRDLGTARWLQASYKLSRGGEHRGSVCNIAVVHRLSDLQAQGDDGSEAVKLARGLLADTGTRAIFAQPASEVPHARELLGLSETQAAHLTRLPPGRALWQVGSHSALVETVRSEREKALTDTDGRMTR